MPEDHLYTKEASLERALSEYDQIEKQHRVQGKTIRRIAREGGWSRRAVRMVLTGASPEYWLGWGPFAIDGSRILFSAVAEVTRGGANWRRTTVVALLLVMRWAALLIVLCATPAGLAISWVVSPIMILGGTAMARWVKVRTAMRLERAVKEDPGFSKYAADNRLFYRKLHRGDSLWLDELVYDLVILPGLLLLLSSVLAILKYLSS